MDQRRAGTLPERVEVQPQARLPPVECRTLAIVAALARTITTLRAFSVRSQAQTQIRKIAYTACKAAGAWKEPTAG